MESASKKIMKKRSAVWIGKEKVIKMINCFSFILRLPHTPSLLITPINERQHKDRTMCAVKIKQNFVRRGLTFLLFKCFFLLLLLLFSFLFFFLFCSYSVGVHFHFDRFEGEITLTNCFFQC